MDPTCQGCDQPIPPKAGRGGLPRKWCSAACARWASRHPGVPRPVRRRCAGCDVDISHRQVGAKYCAATCNRSVPLHARACALPECALPFQPQHARQRCCCERHGKRLYNRESRADGRQLPEPWNDRRRDRYHRRRALMRATASAEPVLREEIAERDRWRCHLCKQRVPRTRAWPHPRSASLDHVIPLSRGGPHEPANVRLAHLSCNTAKGNRAQGEQLLLIG